MESKTSKRRRRKVGRKYANIEKKWGRKFGENGRQFRWKCGK